jgi:hypothetical protein
MMALTSRLGNFILGIGTAAFGMPHHTFVDLDSLLAGVPSGMDAAQVDPATPGPVGGARSMASLMFADPYGRQFIQHCRGKT